MIVNNHTQVDENNKNQEQGVCHGNRSRKTLSGRIVTQNQNIWQSQVPQPQLHGENGAIPGRRSHQVRNLWNGVSNLLGETRSAADSRTSLGSQSENCGRSTEQKVKSFKQQISGKGGS